MKIKLNEILLLILLVIFCIGAFFADLIDNNWLSFFLSFIIFFLVLLFIKNKVGYWNNLTIIFLGFWGLYAFIGPYVNLTEGMFNPYYYNYTYPYYTSKYLFYNSVGFIGFYFAFLNVNPKTHLKDEGIINYQSKYDTNALLNIGIILMSCSLLMELVNIIRVGGVSIFSTGKESYQTMINNLTLTLPSKQFSIVALSTFMIALKGKKLSSYKVKLFIMLILTLPFIIIYLITGSRGSILGLIGIVLLCLTYKNPIRTLKIRYILLIFILYFLMIFMTVNRWYITNAFSTGDYSQLVDRVLSLETYTSRFSLSDNEFVVGLGNFSEGFADAKDNPRYGETYLTGLVAPIPSFLYPTEKPIQILYEFRDTYFSHLRNKEGSVASTGYSIVLEGYLNFKGIGVFFQFFIIGFVLRKLEDYWRKNKNIIADIFYLSISTIQYTLLRSQFASIFNSVVFFIIYIIFVLLIYKIMVKKKGLISSDKEYHTNLITKYI